MRERQFGYQLNVHFDRFAEVVNTHFPEGSPKDLLAWYDGLREKIQSEVDSSAFRARQSALSEVRATEARSARYHGTLLRMKELIDDTLEATTQKEEG